MSYGEMSVEVSLDYRKVDSGLGNLDSTLNSFVGKKWEIGFDVNLSGVVAAVNTTKRLLDGIGVTPAILEFQAKGAGDVARAMDATAAKVKQVNSDWVIGQKEIAKINAELEASAAEAAKLADEQKAYFAGVDATIKTATRNTAEFDKTLAASQKLIDDANMTRLKGAVAGEQAEARHAASVQRDIAAMERQGRQALQTGTMLTFGLTLPLVGASKQIIGTAAEFEKQMRKISALTDTAPGQMNGLSRSLLDLTKNPYITQNASELAQGQFFVSSAGFKGQAGLDVLKPSAMAASAGLGEVKTVAGLVTSVLNDYKMSASDAAKVTDILTQSVKFSKTSIDSLAPSYSRVLPLASAANVSFEEIAASEAVMTRAGLSAQESATALRGILSAIVKPGKQAQDALAGIGLSADGLRQELSEKGLLATLQDLETRTHGNIGTLAQIIPNIRALTGFLSTAHNQAQAYSEALDAMNHSQGATQKAVEEASKSLDFQEKHLRAVATTAEIEIGQKALPTLTRYAEFASKNLPAALDVASGEWRKMSAVEKDAIGGIIGITAAIGPIIAVTGAVQTLEGTLLKLTGAGTVSELFTGAGLTAAAPELLAIAAAAGVAYTAFNFYEKKITDVAAAEAKLTANSEATNRLLSESARYLQGVGDVKLAKQFRDVQTEINTAGTDTVKLHKAIDDLTKLKHEVVVDPKIDPAIKQLVSDDQARAQTLLNERPLLIKAVPDAESQSWWHNFFQRIGQATLGPDYQFGGIGDDTAMGATRRGWNAARSWASDTYEANSRNMSMSQLHRAQGQDASIDRLGIKYMPPDERAALNESNTGAHQHRVALERQANAELAKLHASAVAKHQAAVAHHTKTLEADTAATVRATAMGGGVPNYYKAMEAHVGELSSSLTGTAKDVYNCANTLKFFTKETGLTINSLGALTKQVNVHADALGHYPIGTFLHLGETKRYASTGHYGMAGRINPNGTQEFLESTAPPSNMSASTYHIRGNRTVEQISGRINGAYLPGGNNSWKNSYKLHNEEGRAFKSQSAAEKRHAAEMAKVHREAIRAQAEYNKLLDAEAAKWGVDTDAELKHWGQIFQGIQAREDAEKKLTGDVQARINLLNYELHLMREGKLNPQQIEDEKRVYADKQRNLEQFANAGFNSDDATFLANKGVAVERQEIATQHYLDYQKHRIEYGNVLAKQDLQAMAAADAKLMKEAQLAHVAAARAGAYNVHAPTRALPDFPFQNAIDTENLNDMAARMMGFVPGFKQHKRANGTTYNQDTVTPGPMPFGLDKNWFKGIEADAEAYKQAQEHQQQYQIAVAQIQERMLLAQTPKHSISGGLDRDMLQLKLDWKRDSFTDTEIDKLLNMAEWERATTQMQEYAQQANDKLEGIFQHSLGDVMQHDFKSALRTMENDLSSTLENMAVDLASSRLTQWLTGVAPSNAQDVAGQFGAFGGLLGRWFGHGGSAIAPGPISPVAGGVAGDASAGASAIGGLGGLGGLIGGFIGGGADGINPGYTPGIADTIGGGSVDALSGGTADSRAVHYHTGDIHVVTHVNGSNHSKQDIEDAVHSGVQKAMGGNRAPSAQRTSIRDARRALN